MKKFLPSERIQVIGFFLSIIALGALLLSLPFSWNPSTNHHWIDPLFTSVSAVCVTGLSTVPTSWLSPSGQWILLGLIQFGGLGIFAITTLYLAFPSARISFRSTKVIKEFFVEKVEYKPRRIIRDILLFTFAVELLGALLLQALRGGNFFSSLFHSISAFCNAGFALADDSLLSWGETPLALFTISLLIILGGIGWVVMKNVYQRFLGRIRELSFHSKIVLWVTGGLILTGFIMFFIFERYFNQGSRPLEVDLVNSLFYSITTRTAGFNYIFPSEMSSLSQVLSIPFMIIGASPGSTGGGIKTTTFLVFLLFVLRGSSQEENYHLGKVRLSSATVQRAGVLFVRYVMLFMVSSLLLYGVEMLHHSPLSYLQILYETASSLGTVGLSLDATAKFSDLAKLLLMVNMFVGRVGLLAFSLIPTEKRRYILIKKPKEEVMLG